MRDRQKEYERRNVQPLLVVAQHPFQLKKPREVRGFKWPAEVPAEVLFDPAATVSATYGVAFQTRFRDGPWSSRPAIFVIDTGGVIRHVGSRPNQDLRENDVFAVCDDLQEQRILIVGLKTGGKEWREAARTALGPLGRRSSAAVQALVKALKDEDARVRAGAASALLWMAPRAERAVPALTEALRDPDSRVRRLAAAALARIPVAPGGSPP